jgi:hypothetical protein
VILVDRRGPKAHPTRSPKPTRQRHHRPQLEHEQGSTLDTAFADPDLEAMCQKLNEMILNGRR